MARKPEKMDDTRLQAIVEDMIADAVSFDSSERKERREYSLEYTSGRMPDLVSGEDQSSVVSQDIADAKAQLLPSLMRVFCASDRIGIYEPQNEDDEAFAEQATDYANFVFLRECNGENLLRDVFDDALGLGNGIIKHWWDKTREYKTETLSGLTDAQFAELLGDDYDEDDPRYIKVLEHSEYPDPSAEAMVSPDAALAGSVGGDPLAGAGGNPLSAGNAPGGMPAGLGDPTAGQPVPAAVSSFQAPPPGPMAPGAMAGSPFAGGAMLQPGGDGGPAPAGALDAGPLASAEIDPRLAIGGNFPPAPMLHDVKIRRVTRNGRMRISAVADEDFLIESSATGLNEDECRFCAHRETPTRSQLIERGYDPDLVDELGSVNEAADSSSRRRGTFTTRSDQNDDFEDRAGERVEVYECYALLDVDGDGITEWHQIVMGGSSGSQKLLRQTEWGGMLPFTDIVPDPVPHVWRGRSLYDRLRDVQRVNTVLYRKMLDNLYQTVEPQRAVDMTSVENPDAVYNYQLGATIRVKAGRDVRSVITDLAVPFVAKEAMPMIEEMRKVAERRVGVGEQSSGLDGDVLQGQVATAVAATQSASALRKEDYARNIQMGMRRLFSAVLKLIVEHQDRERTIRLRNKWVPIDPRSWNADMDVTVNVGLGAGNRDRDLAMLQGIKGAQEQIIATQGLDNGWVGLKEYAATLTMMVEAAGVKSPDRFFPEVTDQMLAAMQQKAMAKAQQPDPKTAAAQAQAQIAAQKAQMDGQIAQQRAQADMGLQQARAQADAQLNAAKMQQQQAIMQAKLEADMRVREAQAQHQMDLDRQKAQADTMKLQLQAQADTEIAHAKMQAQLQIEQAKADAQMRLKERELQLEAMLKQQQFAAGLDRGSNLEFPV
jgi:hypothetical protein